MENTTPFADAISNNASTQPELSQNEVQLKILRKSNHELKLELIDLKEAIEAIDNILAKVNK
tara:strand:+ start:405 stop:590 length:186 start_codon:yes stop_codon:yes gene_type:complete